MVGKTLKVEGNQNFMRIIYTKAVLYIIWLSVCAENVISVGLLPRFNR